MPVPSTAAWSGTDRGCAVGTQTVSSFAAATMATALCAWIALHAAGNTHAHCLAYRTRQTALIAWLKFHPGELHFETDDRFECVSGMRELLIAHRHACRETFEGNFGFWGTCDEHADAGPERWRCYVDRLFDGYYRIRRSRFDDWERTRLSREDLTQTLRAYARHELKKLLAMARGESHRGVYEIPEPVCSYWNNTCPRSIKPSSRQRPLWPRNPTSSPSGHL